MPSLELSLIPVDVTGIGITQRKTGKRKSIACRSRGRSTAGAMTACKRIILRKTCIETKTSERPAHSLIGVLDVFDFAAKPDVVPAHNMRGNGPEVVSIGGLFTEVVSDDGLIA